MGLCESKRNDFEPIYDNEDPLKFYDIIVDIKSIKEIEKGWDILTNDKGKRCFKENNESDIKIGAIGNGNKGKSFILSKISGIDLPTGFSVRTKGLSIKFPVINIYKNRNIILLDSAGQETPVLNNEKNEKKNDNNSIIQSLDKGLASQSKEIIIQEKQEKLLEESRDKLLTEFFLQNYIVKFTDLLLIVVGQLSFSEQKLIDKIKKIYIYLKKKNDLVIIHNLQSYVTKKQVANYINDILKKSYTFDIKAQNIINNEKEIEEWTYFHEPNSNPKTIHLIFARDKSEAGDFYNQKTINYLYSMINNIREKEPLNLYENIKKFFIDISSEILENPLQTNNIILENNTIKLANLPKDYTIKLKKCLIDELGLTKFSFNRFEPNYSYYIDNNYLHIICEIPGTIDFQSFKCNANCENGKCIIKIYGNKIKDIKIDKNDFKKFFSNRDFGNFILDIVIENVNIDIDKGKIYNKNNGLIEIIYPTKKSTATLYLNQ